MTYRQIDEAMARKCREILVDECGLREEDRYCGFVQTVATTGKRWDTICTEYRFMGALGFGGKFRNNGNNNGVPYVDCYREHETPARTAMINRANERLLELFSDPPRQTTR